MNLIAYKIVDTIFIRGDGSNAFGDYIPGSGSSSSSSSSSSISTTSSSSSSSEQSNSSSSSSSVCLNWLSWGSQHYGLKDAPQGLNISNIKEMYRVNGTNIILDTSGKLWIWGKCDKGLCNIPQNIGVVRSIGVSVSDNNIIANAVNGLYFWGDNYQSRCSGKLLSCSFDLEYPDGNSNNTTQTPINPYQIGEDFYQYKNNGVEELQSEPSFTVQPDSSSGHYWKWKPVLHVITTVTGGITRTERTTHQFNSLSRVHASLGSLAVNVDTIYEWEESPKIYNQNNQWVNRGGDYITQWKSFGWNGSCSLFGDSKMCLTHKSNHVRWDGSNPLGVQLANINYAQEKIVNGWTMMFINFQNEYVIDKCGRNLHNELDVHSSMQEWKDMACGWSHCCGINSGDQIVCWGENQYGQLNIPFQLNFVEKIWVGANTTIALDENNILWSWGQNTDGQCGTDAERYKWDGTLNPTGTRQDSLGSFTGTGRAYWKKDLSSIKIKTIITSARMKNTYDFVAYDGFTILLEEVPCDTISSSSSSSSSSEYCTQLYAYGTNDWYQSEVPLNLKFGNKQISAGKNHNLVIKNDNTVAAWGKNDYGQCNVPSSLGPCKAISAGRNHSVALKNDGSVVAWGYNNHGQCLGTDSEGYVINTPEVSTGTQLAQIDGIPLTNIIAIAAGVAHTVCLTDTGKVLCFGAGGKIREYSTDADKQQCQVPSLLNTDIYPCVAIAAGDYHTFALQSNGLAHLWGFWNGGLNVPECYNLSRGYTPVNKINAGSINSIFADENGYCIWYNDVSLRWSRGEYDPTVSGGIRQIEVGKDHAIILNNNNTIWARGRNNFNQLSVRDDNIDNAISISAGDNHTLILTSNCTLSSSSSSSKTCSTPDTATPKINMLRIQQSGIDSTQYVEFSGQPGLDLSEYTFIIIGDDTYSTPLLSIIEYILPLTGMIISSDGYYSVASDSHQFLSPNRLPDKELFITPDWKTDNSKTYMIVKGFTGNLDMVINTTGSGDPTTGQGIIDVPFGEIVDSFAIGSSGARIPNGQFSNWYYSTNIAKISNYVLFPSKVNRCINGTYESDDWNSEFSQDGDRLGVCHYCVGE